MTETGKRDRYPAAKTGTLPARDSGSKRARQLGIAFGLSSVPCAVRRLHRPDYMRIVCASMISSQVFSGSTAKICDLEASTVYQAPLAISPASWPGDQPE
jgi:hypothetical protein